MAGRQSATHSSFQLRNVFAFRSPLIDPCEGDLLRRGNNVGLSPAAITPVPLVLVMVRAAILAANAIALPARRQWARLNPAAVLRSE
jgi:hypothetical protein